MNSISINEKVANGEFEFFAEAEVVHIKQKFITLQSLLNLQMQFKNKLNRLIPTKLGQLVPIVILEGGISIALAMVFSNQDSFVEDGSGHTGSPDEEVKQKLKEAEKISNASIKEGSKIAREMLKKNFSREDLKELLSNVPDERVVRNVIDAARQNKVIVDFKGGSQVIGGGLDIPAEVVGKELVRLNNCRVVGVIGNGEFDVETDDVKKLFDRQDSRRNIVRVSTDLSSPLGFFLHMAGWSSVKFDFEVRVTEEIKSKKLKFLVMKLIDPSQILSLVESNITDIKKSLQFDLNFNKPKTDELN